MMILLCFCFLIIFANYAIRPNANLFNWFCQLRMKTGKPKKKKKKISKNIEEKRYEITIVCIRLVNAFHVKKWYSSSVFCVLVLINFSNTMESKSLMKRVRSCIWEISVIRLKYLWSSNFNGFFFLFHKNYIVVKHVQCTLHTI